MDGNTPFEKLKSLIPNIKEEIALFPPFILDKIIPIYQHIPFAKKDKKIIMGSPHSQPGNNLYNLSYQRKICPSQFLQKDFLLQSQQGV